MSVNPADTVVVIAVGAMLSTTGTLFAYALVQDAQPRILLGLMLATFLAFLAFMAVALAVVL